MSSCCHPDPILDIANEGQACIITYSTTVTSAGIKSLSIGKAYVLDECDKQDLEKALEISSRVAKSHPGSNSLDGSGSATVSTSHGVVAALAGHALMAAEYAAYASVYSYASYAVTDLAAYESEHTWQIEKFRELAEQPGTQSEHCI